MLWTAPSSREEKAIMSAPVHPVLALLITAFLGAPCLAQQETDISTRPLRPLTRRELDRREALHLYAQASEHEHRNRLPEALRIYEKALRQDPDSTAILRALATLYLALDRQQESLDACKRVVSLDPEDFETWCNYARQLRSQDKEA